MLKAFLKTTLLQFQRLISTSPTLTSIYLNTLGRIAKSLPDRKWKQHLLNQVGSIDWPDSRIQLPPATTEIASGFCFRLIPHLKEFDFEAHLFQRLSYEQEVFQWLRNRRYDVVIEIGANVGVYSLKRYRALGGTEQIAKGHS